MGTVAFGEGLLPRDDPGWKPLPQEQFFVIDRMAPDAEVRAKGVDHEIYRG
jgi:hypothetical protein